MPKLRIRDIAVRKATSYIKSRSFDLPSVRELCLISGASQRTLEYGFKEKYGIGPKDFMKKQGLNNAHRLLKKANPKHAHVQHIAHQVGFWHMGQFGADYKKMFGELPSQTLSK